MDVPKIPAALVRWGAFPAAVGVGFVGLVAAQISGSSIGILSDKAPIPGLLAGTPRAVRSDEYLLVTPSNLSSVAQGFPSDPWIGLAPTDLEVAVHSGVSLDWTTLFHPDDWGYLFLGPGSGLAFSWWWSFVISLWGIFALLGLITKAPALSAALAVVATFTPYSAWWSAAPPSLLAGYGAAAGACLIVGWRTRRLWLAVLASVVAAGFGLALALVLYPPWAVSVAIVVAAVIIGHAIDQGFRWRRVFWVTALALGGAGVGLLVWYIQNGDAIAALAGTYYPGSRVTKGGEIDLFQLLSAPLNFWTAGAAGATVGTMPGTAQFANLSGLSSSWIPIPAMVLVAVGAGQLVVSRFRARRVSAAASDDLSGATFRPPLWALVAVTIATGVLLAWALIPLPEWVGIVTQLNRVQASRTPLALGFGAILMAALAARMSNRPSAWTLPWAVAAAALTSALTVWAAFRFPWDTALVPMALVLGSGFVLGGLYAGLFCISRPLWPALALTVYALLSWVLINPVQQGIGPIAEDPLVADLQSIAGESDNRRVVVFSDFRTVAKVRAAGFQSVSGQTPIPDASVMQVIAPGDELKWNNYVKYLWTPAERGAPTTIETIVGTTLLLTIDPCADSLHEAVDPGWIVSNDAFDDAPCVELEGTSVRADGATLFIYRYAQSR